MHWRKAVLVWVLLTIPLLSFGCGGQTYENIPTVVITPEMLEKMEEEETQRQEKYRYMSIPERNR